MGNGMTASTGNRTGSRHTCPMESTFQATPQRVGSYLAMRLMLARPLHGLSFQTASTQEPGRCCTTAGKQATGLAWESGHLRAQRTAPATKSALRGSPSAVPGNLHHALCLPRNLHFEVHKVLRGSPSAVPATRPARRGSPSASPATKSALRGSPRAVPATRPARRGSPSAARATKSALRGTVPATNSAIRGPPSALLATKSALRFFLQAFLVLTVREREATLLVSWAASGRAKSGQVQATGPVVRGGGGCRWVSAEIPREVG